MTYWLKNVIQAWCVLSRGTKFAILFVAIALTLLFWPRSPVVFFSGTVEIDEYYLGTPVAGRIKELYVDEGDRVEKDQVLVELEHYEQANRDYHRAKALFESQAASEQNFEYAAMALKDQLISSPIQGVVLQKLYDKGEIAPAGGRVLVIADPKVYWVKIYIPQSLISRVKLGMKAHMRIEGLDEVFKGSVRYISPFVEFTPRAVQTPLERATQTFSVKVYFETSSPTLRPGISADVFFEDL